MKFKNRIDAINYIRTYACTDLETAKDIANIASHETLRDTFACHALQIVPKTFTGFSSKDIVRTAYRLADDMLEERNKEK